MSCCVNDWFVKLAYPEKDNFALYFQENLDHESIYDPLATELLRRAEEEFLKNDVGESLKILKRTPGYSVFARAMELHFGA